MYKQPTLEPIAIIGSSCRFAGEATSPTKLWQVLANPPDLSKEVPPNRFNAHAFYHKDGEHHGTTNSIKAYWLEQDHKVFDASFFNITPREAEAIDPQQRLLLEVVYEAMESAGYTLAQCSGKNIGVFAGVMTADYDTLSQRDELSASQYYATGNARSIISNRVSYFFNFRGPSMTIDTACSSSLVALHQAVLNLRSGDISMACVAGVNLMITPEQFIVESSLHMLSPTGKSRMWDENADGYARGEGVAAIFLKPLSLALHDGDEILGLIRQTGVNSDGRTQGITMPSSEAQASLIRNTYYTSGLDPQKKEDQCQYFEAHGTGTQAGDPREAQAIQRAFFGQNQTTKHNTKILVGSVKTVIGHTEGAAGLAGLLKVLQSMKHGRVPPNLHLHRLNPTIQPFYENLEIPTLLSDWPIPSAGQPKRASVNSFGFGGTNSHAIIEQYDPVIHGTAARPFSNNPGGRMRSDLSLLSDSHQQKSLACFPLLLSASSQKSLRGVIRTWRDYLLKNPEVPLQQLAWNLVRHRTALPYRISVAVTTNTQAIDVLQNFINHESDSVELGIRSKISAQNPRILGIFTGQGAQWPSMSRQLLLSNPKYCQTIRQLDKILQESPDPPSWSLEQQILADGAESRIHEAQIAQPLSTAVQIGLVDLLNSIGIKFQAVVGHSSGEIAAAYAAERLSARDAMLISYYRGMYAHLSGGTDGEKGAMLAAGMSESEALAFCRDPTFHGKICVAASNSPSSVTLSGDVQMIHLARNKLTAQARFVRLLLVDTAYHSPHMIQPALAYTEALQKCGISPLPETNQVKWISSVYGFSQTSERDLASSYWKDNMVYAVQFFDAVKTALSEFGPFDCAFEVGPHPALKGPVMQTAKAVMGGPVPYYGVLERSKADNVAFAEFLGSIWCQLGPSAVDLGQYVQQASDPLIATNRLVNLPSYHWDHSQTHYRESRISKQYHFKKAAPHELLGTRTRDDNEFEFRWRNILRPDKLPWLKCHSFQGQALVPASAYCVMAFDAAVQILDGRDASVIEIRDLDIMSGISMEPESAGTEILFSLSLVHWPKDHATSGVITATFKLTSCPSGDSTTMKMNARGNLSIILDDADIDALPRRRKSLSETLPASSESFYKMMDDTGLVYSGPFRALQSIQRSCDFASTTLRRRHAEDTTSLAVSPATLDSCFQSAFLTWSSPGDKSLWTSFLPTRIERVQFNIALCRNNLSQKDDSILSVDSHLINVHGSTLVSKAELTVEIGIYNERDEMEIEIEGLTVAAIAKTRPEDDHELYLHTVMNIDPEDELVLPDTEEGERYIPELVEVCDRIASFYAHGKSETSYGLRMSSNEKDLHVRPRDQSLKYASDTEAHIEALVNDSLFRGSLETLQDLGRIMPALLPSALPMIISEATVQFHFGRHVEKLVDQICHRYPRMNVLSILDSKTTIGDCVLKGLGSSFVSFTAATFEGGGQETLSTSVERNGKVHRRYIRLEEDISTQLNLASRSDLIVLATSALGKSNPEALLRNIRASMNDGGFLVLIQATDSPMKKGFNILTGNSVADENVFIPQSEQELLDMCGFMRVARNADQSFGSGYSISVRQAAAPFVDSIAKPFGSARPSSTEKLLIVGVASDQNSRISQYLQLHLSRFCGAIELRRSIENLNLDPLHDYTSVIILEDLESSVVSVMTEKKLSQLKDLFQPSMTVLWTTHNARSGDPQQASSLGFTRTVSAEVPSLKFQVLDLDDIEGSEALIAETFVRLITKEPPADKSLWVRETEVYMENGKRLVARVLPLKTSNDRANAIRRVVKSPISTISSVVRIVPYIIEHGRQGHEAVGLTWNPRQIHGSGKISLRLLSSTLEAVRLAPGIFAHVCLGQDDSTGKLKLALSTTNASYIEVPMNLAQDVPDINMTGTQFIHCVMRYLVILAVFKQDTSKDKRHTVFIDSDQLLLECVKAVMARRPATFASWEFNRGKSPKVTDSIQIHPRSSDRQLNALLASAGTDIYDFSTGCELSHRLEKLLRGNSKYHPGTSILTSGQTSSSDTISLDPEVGSILSHAITLAASTSETFLSDCTEALPFNDALAGTNATSFINVIDWTVDRRTNNIVKPLVEQQLFHPDKTYILVGLTRDLGQSLSRLFVQHGARHLVLASRNPNMSPGWTQELGQEYGAQIVMEKMDVTSLEDVLRFKKRLAETMPIVGGVINGAMVLDDRVFSQMTVETWNRVLQPKTTGSKNLDTVFSDPALEFFIMTSSFAAIGGHPGQSNYAAANMYMNGLAVNRRKRGLTGSVLNIGVIYGLGLLQREKEELYIGLEREGYPPISERDIHHMFLEAIVAGRPGTCEPLDITTGLKRFKWGSANPLHWHLDPRFSHFTSDDGASKAEPEAGSQRSLLDQLSSMKDIELMAGHLVDAFAGHLQVMLQLQDGSVNGHNSLSEIGIDSLVAVDIRNWIWRTLGRDVAVMKILGVSSIYKLCLDIVEQIHAESNVVDDSSTVSTPLTSRTPSEASGPSSVGTPSAGDKVVSRTV